MISVKEVDKERANSKKVLMPIMYVNNIIPRVNDRAENMVEIINFFL